MAAEKSKEPEQWHGKSVEEVIDTFSGDQDEGLTEGEAQERLQSHGPNQLRQVSKEAWWKILLRQFESIVVQLLVGAAVLAFATSRTEEGVAVLAVILINTGIGFFSEWKANRSMAALRKMGEHETRVLREGKERTVSAADVVPGDIVLLEAGELIPADLRLIAADKLRVNEAALTGESVAAEKTVDAVDPGTELADRSDMLYKGTTVADGSARGIAVATGLQTELGRISELAGEAGTRTTPLQRRLNELGRKLAWITIGIALVLAVVGVLVRQQDITLIIETALALGIAAIPEGLPIVATIALARGMYLMARRNALVNQLTAVQTLGATTIIFTDKTGTLTENRMSLHTLMSWQGERQLEGAKAENTEREGESSSARRDEPTEPLDAGASRVLKIGVLCNSAELAEADEDGGKGDPTEIALLEGGRQFDVERAKLLEEYPQVRVEDFDPEVKMMATFHQNQGRYLVAVKGAPSAVLEVCSTRASGEGDKEKNQPLQEDDRTQWQDKEEQLASQGLRLLAMAEKTVESEDAEPYEDLCFLGLVGLLDPPRDDVRDAINTCQSAGIRVEMITGDQPSTGRAIAEAVGIVGEAEDPEAHVMRGSELQSGAELSESDQERVYKANIFARVNPEQKLQLVESYQNRGETVAMTGDGINDAPALKKADIGIAMGRRGTEAAKQVADMVLLDDAFATIVAAVENGRVIFKNIRKAVMFMLCTNVAEVLAISVAILVGLTLPLKPLQILYLNVLTDVFPALALGVGPGSGHEMSESPRDPGESILTRRHWLEITGWALLIAVCVLSSLLLAREVLGLSDNAAVTVSFLTIGFGKLWFTFNLRSANSGPFINEITRNPWVWGALVLCTVLLVSAVYLPGLGELLKTRSPGPQGWLLILGMSLIPLIVGYMIHPLRRKWEISR